MALTIDFNLATRAQVGPAGLERTDFAGLSASLTQALDALDHAHERGALQFMRLPQDTAAAQAAIVLGKQLARDFDELVVLGIGGSSLGGKALFAALSHPLHNLVTRKQRSGGTRLFFPDNSDPSTFAALLDHLDLSRTAFAAITKSGGTAETWAQLLEIHRRLGAEAAKRQIVAITDPTKGALRSVAQEHGWATLPVPPAVGGRFSVLTAVGTLPLAAAGVDVAGILAGAGAMAERCRTRSLEQNPAAMLAAALFLFDTRRQRPLHVLMPYADALRETGDWFVQLWAESLGKKKGTGFVGPTPLRAVGATDQHSILQLLMEGPQDKVTVFIAAAAPRVDLTIPKGFESQPDVRYLGGHTMHGLLSAEQQATSAALAAAGRPSLTIRIPKLDPFSLGELIMLWEVATGIAGTLYGIDPYDQPGVEAGKRYTCGLLGRPGYEEAKAELDARPKPSPDWIL